MRLNFHCRLSQVLFSHPCSRLELDSARSWLRHVPKPGWSWTQLCPGWDVYPSPEKLEDKLLDMLLLFGFHHHPTCEIQNVAHANSSSFFSRAIATLFYVQQHLPVKEKAIFKSCFRGLNWGGRGGSGSPQGSLCKEQPLPWVGSDSVLSICSPEGFGHPCYLVKKC